jgi:hypothetical protein
MQLSHFDLFSWKLGLTRLPLLLDPTVHIQFVTLQRLFVHLAAAFTNTKLRVIATSFAKRFGLDLWVVVQRRESENKYFFTWQPYALRAGGTFWRRLKLRHPRSSVGGGHKIDCIYSFKANIN